MNFGDHICKKQQFGNFQPVDRNPPTLPCSSQAGRRLGPPLVWSFSLPARLSRHQCLSPCLRQCLRLHASFRSSCLVPPNASKTSPRLSDSFGRLVTPTDCFGRTSAAPPKVFYDLSKLLFGTPKPFQPFQNLAAPQRLLQRLQESFMTFRNCCLSPPNPSNPSNTSQRRLQESFMTFRNCCLAPPNPSNPSKTSQLLRDCCSASKSLL